MLKCNNGQQWLYMMLMNISTFIRSQLNTGANTQNFWGQPIYSWFIPPRYKASSLQVTLTHGCSVILGIRRPTAEELDEVLGRKSTLCHQTSIFFAAELSSLCPRKMQVQPNLGQIWSLNLVQFQPFISNTHNHEKMARKNWHSFTLKLNHFHRMVIWRKYFNSCWNPIQVENF